MLKKAHFQWAFFSTFHWGRFGGLGLWRGAAVLVM
jgi:hypothetical protein